MVLRHDRGQDGIRKGRFGGAGGETQMVGRKWAVMVVMVSGLTAAACGSSTTPLSAPRHQPHASQIPKQVPITATTTQAPVAPTTAVPPTTTTTVPPAPPATTTTRPPPPPTTTTTAAPPPPPPVTTPPAAPTGCHPTAASGNCYQAGEFCSAADHGLTGVAGNGEAIACENNNGWRWEPA